MNLGEKKMEIGLIIAGIALVIGLVSWKVSGPDNEIEEQTEEVIEDLTGIDIDISFNSEEKD